MASTRASEAMSGRLPEMSVQVSPPLRLEDVAHASAGDEAARVAVEDGVGMRRVGRVDGDAGDVPVRQAGRVTWCQVPP